MLRVRPLEPTLLLVAFALGCGDSSTTPDALVPPDGERSDAQPTRSDGQLPSADAGTIDLGSGPADLGLVVDLGVATDAAPPLDAGGTSPSDAGSEVQARPPATLVILPDTQYYAAAYPDVFDLQTSWVVAQKTALNIAAVLHVGDIVDSDIEVQWTVANPAMRLLDNVVPYVVVPGNHDYGSINRASLIDNYFAPASMPWVTGTMEAGQIENNYSLVDIGPQKWLVLGIEFGPRDAVVDWAKVVLRTYAQYPAILLTHAYLYSDGTRYDINVGGTDPNKSNYQYWSPYYYAFTPNEGINDGEQLWQKLVLPNSNVRLVFCGHQTGAARLTSTRPDGTTVHQMLSDYQWLEGQNFGFGYMRVVQLDYDKKTIQVQTYSPYLNQYLEDDLNKFTLDLNL
jgi:hypothetical protein